MALSFLVAALMLGASAQGPHVAAHGCDAGRRDACADLAFLYDTGKGLPQNRDRAAHLYAVACEKGLMAACYNAGIILYETGRKIGAGRVFAMFCERKARDACYYLAHLYAFESGFPSNYPLALRLLGDLCSTDYGLACNALGLMYDDGQGVSQNARTAMTFYTKACTLKAGLGCFNLGVSFYNGEGVGQDYSRAERLFAKACDLGASEGCDAVGKARSRAGEPNEDDAGSSQTRVIYVLDHSEPAPPPSPPPVTPVGGWGGIYGCFGQIC